MPHIAVVVSGLLGRMHSGFELMSRLEDEGHRVTCLCQPYTTHIVAKQGFDYLEIPEINFKYIDTDDSPENRSWSQNLSRHMASRKRRYASGKKLLKLEAYEEIWQRLRPDRVLIDVELHDLIFTAYASKIPIILFHTWFSDIPVWGLPPIRTSIIPGEGFEGSDLGIAWARLVDKAKIQIRLLINKLTFQDYRRSTIARYAKEIGFPVSDLSASTLPPLYRFTKLPIVLLAMHELDFQHRPDQNLMYAGPMVYDKRHDVDEESEEAKRLNAIYAHKNASGKKLIYCSVGSLAKGDVSFLKKVITVVGSEREWLLILSLGRNLSYKSFPDIPENVHLFQWVPQIKVLAHADCCINHAGINSINECLHHAVPMVIYSLKYTDENGNAARMAYHGLAVVGDKDKDSADTIHNNIREVLTDARYAEKIAEFNALYKLYNQRKLSSIIFNG